MKELLQQTKDEIGIHAEEQEKREFKLIDQQRKINGLTLWEYNLKTKEIKPATYKKIDLSLDCLPKSAADIKINHRVDVKDNCVYFQALNLKNAKKWVLKRGGNV